MIMKLNFLKWMVCMCFGLLSVATVMAGGNYKTVKVKAPFPMQPIKVFIYPDRDFKITDFGAVPGGEVDNTKAIAAAIDACNKAGGGRVVVPAGIWLTGPVHFKSNINLYLEENAEAEYFSSELKKKAGFGKGGEKGFDGVITALQMQTYLCVRDFRQRKNKKGEAYGWPVAVYCTPEHLWGRDHVTSAYTESAASSGEKIAAHMREIYPIATRQQVHRLVGNIVAL